MTSCPHIVHIPTPGDHYSVTTGSAPMSIIYELSRAHAARGGTTTVVVGAGTVHDYSVGEVREVPFPALPSRRKKALDAGSGRLGLRRFFVESAYRPALDVIPADFTGTLVVHNAPGAVALFARHRPRGRTCLYAHNELFATFGAREAWRTVSAADVVVCDSQFLADALQSRLRRPLSSVRVVLNGVDVDRFRPTPPPESMPPVILFVGRVIPEKGPHLLLAAAARIAGRGRRFTVRIVGSSGFSATDPLTPYERHLRQLAAPIAEHVEFVPFTGRREVVGEYRRASIGCVPSDWDEPCSLTMPEALAAGLPVVAARRGGLPEVGQDAALWFLPPDVDRLAGHLAHLLDDPAARALWGARARARALQISWERQYEVFRAALAPATGG